MRRTTPIRDLLRDEADFVHRLARALLRDPDLAADVAQDTLVAACEHPPAAASRPQFRAWLRAVAKRFAFAALRRRDEQAKRERVAAKSESSDSEAEARRHLDLHRRLFESVETLPEPYRTVVVLRFARDLSPRAIAAECGTSAELVRQRLHRGLCMLRERLDRSPGGRPEWTAAFAAAGISLAPHAALVTALMTKKLLAVAAVLFVAVGMWGLSPSPSRSANASPDGPAASAVASAVRIDEPDRAPGETATTLAMRANASLRVHVRDENGQPVPVATVHDCRSDEPPVAVACEADGTAKLPREARARELVVRAPNYLATRTIVAADAEDSVVTLMTGASVSGIVMVDGVPADAGLELSMLIEPSADPADGTASEAALRLLTPDEERKTRTLPRGRFSFAELPHDWRGTLVVPRTHWILRDNGEPYEQPRALDLAAPQTELTVRTTKLPTISGRVVFEDGSPASGAKVFMDAMFEDDTPSAATYCNADPEGRFELALVPVSAHRFAKFADPAKRSRLLRASFLAGAADTLRTSLLWPPSAGHAVDGANGIELRLVRLPKVHFLVVDEKSRPIAGARIQTDHNLTDLTDANGRGIAYGTPTGVAAPDHAVATAHAALRGSGTTDDPKVFALKSSRDLILRVRTPNGSPLLGCRLEAHYADGLLPGLSECGALYSSAWRLQLQPYRSDDGRWQFHITIDGEATARAPAPPAGSRCTLRVLDSVGSMLSEVDVVAPVDSDAPIDLVIAGPVATLRGRVHVAGVPPRRAMVSVHALERRIPFLRTPTHSDGSFSITCLHTRTPLVVVLESPGFAPQQRQAFADRFLEVELTPGRSIEVTAIDPEGRLVPVPRVVAITGLDAADNTFHQLEGGRFRYDDLPLRGVTFRCGIGGRIFDEAAVDGATTATVHLPRLATLRVLADPMPEIVEGQSLEPRGQPFQVHPHDGIVLLPPGRYRFEGAEPVELDLRAGETAEIALH